MRAGKITKDSVLVITSSEHRTQLANKEAALQRAQMCIFGAIEDAAPQKEASDAKQASETDDLFHEEVNALAIQ